MITLMTAFVNVIGVFKYIQRRKNRQTDDIKVSHSQDFDLIHLSALKAPYEVEHTKSDILRCTVIQFTLKTCFEIHFCIISGLSI